MNTFVVYESQFGNTEQIAQAIADTLRAFGQVELARVDPAHPVELQEADLLILGCPTQAFRPTPAAESFLEHISTERFHSLAIACFDTRVHGPFGSAARHLVKQLRARGIEPLVPPENFFVKGKEGPLAAGEVERATRWALNIHQQFEATRLHLAAR